MIIRVRDLLDLMYESEKVNIFSVELKHQHRSGTFRAGDRSEVSEDVLNAPVRHFWRSDFSSIYIEID